MLVDNFMGSKNAKITISIALGVLLSSFLPDNIEEWVGGTGSWRQISRAIMVLLGFPAVILLEKIYEKIRTRQIVTLLQEGNIEQAVSEMGELNATNPVFLDSLSKKLEEIGVVLVRD